ncbi:MAG: DegT/DnrJ/EryC1/StrS family aminotransferase [Myxococcales bacterium]|nr:DegT/DnrJ/EryC1/StrS family aminotransferase [Myxococcales bacterium]
MKVPPLPSDRNATGRTFDEQERAYLMQVMDSGTLICTSGTHAKAFEEDLAKVFGAKFALSCSSGSAAVHTAVAAVDPEPGDEIITTPITDMGALTAILYQGAIPIFADVDPVTLNVTPETIRARITPRTKAIIATHLFGNPCDMDGILAIAQQHDLPVIEDAAQALLAKVGDKYTGTIGNIGCFSLQQSKHITTGEGGFILVQKEELRRRMFLFINKAWPYNEPNPDHEFLAPNYRMTDLQGAVGRGQIAKLHDVVAKRQASAARFVEELADIDGLTLPKAAQGSVHAFWKMPLIIDSSKIDGGVDAVSAKLNAMGVMNAPHYVKKPAYQCRIFAERRTFGNSQFPWSYREQQDGTKIVYDDADFPGAIQGLRDVLVLNWNELYTDSHVSALISAVREACR